MSKKRSRSRATTAKAQPVQTDKRAAAMRALDGFINSLAYLGEANELEKANDYERHTITRDFELLTVMYRENWLTKRIIDLPCEDMTRAWYSISSEIEQDKLDEVAKLEAKHNVKQEVTNMMRWARLYGGAAAVIVIKGQEDMLDQPLDFDTLVPGCFRGLIVVDRTNGLYPSIELEEDMDDPEYGYPKYYNVITDTLSGETLRVHHSRLLQARGRMLPIQEEINEDYWGASEIEHIYEELQKRNATSANIAQLVFQANVSAMKIGNFGEAMATGTDQMKQKIMQAIFDMNRIKNSSGLLVMGADDNYEQHPYSFAGIAEVYEAFMLDMAGAAEIPATKLFGRSPQGMNSTGESDMNNYYEKLAQLQENQLRPAIEKLLPVMAMSLWGEIPEDMEIVFKPLATTTPADRAEIMSKQAATVVQAFSAGIISQKMALRELQEQGKSIGAWNTITDDDIERADDEFDQGEGMEDPMGMMGPGGPGDGEMPPEGPGGPGGAPAPEEAPEQAAAPQEQSNQDPRAAKIAELRQRIERIRARETGEEPADDQSEKIHELKERVHKLRAGKQPKTADLPTLQAQVQEAVEKGDIQGARAAIEQYRSSKHQTEQVQDPKHSSFVGDVLRRIISFFRGKDWEESKHPRGKGGKFAPKGSGSASGGGESEGSTVKSSEPLDNNPHTEHNGGAGKSTAGWKGLKAAMEVGGPKAAREYCKKYLADHPDVAREVPKYMDVRKKVANFTTDHPEAENFNTYDAETGKVKPIDSGFCVTFHQNNTPDDPLGAYSDEDYAAMCAIAIHELGADGVNIGYYGNPEVSFVCQDEKAAKEFAIRHNQQSVYNAKTGRTLVNKQWRKELNPIRL